MARTAQVTGSGQMNVGIAIRHPEHAHLYRRPVERLRERGHEVSLFVREFRDTTELLDRFGVAYTLLADEPDGIVDLFAGHLRYEVGVLRAARRADVDVLTSVGGRAVSHIAPLLDVPCVVFADWTPGAVDRAVARLADVVATPAFLRGEYGPRQVVYDGLHELAYLRPDPEAPEQSNGATLDHGTSDVERSTGSTTAVAFTPETADASWVTETVATLDATGRVLVVGGRSPAATEHVSERVSRERVHTALADADRVVTDLGTVATEAAVLGTPTVFVGGRPPRRCSYLAREYGLVELADPTSMPVAVETHLGDDPGPLWAQRRQALLEDTVDVADYVVDRLIEVGA